MLKLPITTFHGDATTSQQGFANICAAIRTLDLCLIQLMNVALPDLISDEDFIAIGDRAALLCNGAIKPFWFFSEILN